MEWNDLRRRKELKSGENERHAIQDLIYEVLGYLGTLGEKREKWLTRDRPARTCPSCYLS